MADKNKKDLKNWLRKARQYLLDKSKGGKGDKSGLEQIEELMTEEEKKKKR